MAGFTAGTPIADAPTQCFPHGIPRLMASPYPIEFVYAPGLITILHEVAHNVRFIHMDGKPAPANTPRPIIDKLNKALRDALASDEVKRQLAQDGTEITPGTPEDYAAFIDKDEEKWSQLVKASGVEQE